MTVGGIVTGAGVVALVALITTVVSLVGIFWVQGALVYAVEDSATGGSTRRSASCSSAYSRISGR